MPNPFLDDPEFDASGRDCDGYYRDGTGGWDDLQRDREAEADEAAERELEFAFDAWFDPNLGGNGIDD